MFDRNSMLPVAHGFRLLTPGNPKTEKGLKAGYWTFILHLAPAKLSGFQVCPMATAGCKAACLNTAGRGGMAKGVARLTAEDVAAGRSNSIQAARIRKTRVFFEHRAEFMVTLVADIRKGIRKAAALGLKPVFRLNGTSDIRWEAIPVEGARNVFELFPDVQFYDYTKLPNRKGLPSNYSVTFSLADGNDDAAAKAMLNGLNVAVVFRSKALVEARVASGWGPFPGQENWPVVRGDDTDLRFLDPKGPNGMGLFVGLYAKGNATTDRSGFVVD